MEPKHGKRGLLIPPNLMSVPQICKIVPVSENLLYAMIHEGKLTHWNCGRRLLVQPEDFVKAFKVRQRIEPDDHDWDRLLESIAYAKSKRQTTSSNGDSEEELTDSEETVEDIVEVEEELPDGNDPDQREDQVYEPDEKESELDFDRIHFELDEQGQLNFAKE